MIRISRELRNGKERENHYAIQVLGFRLVLEWLAERGGMDMERERLACGECKKTTIAAM